VLSAHEVLFQGLHLVQAFHHELDVVSGREAHETAAVLVGDLADLADVLHGHEPATAALTVKTLSPVSET
jgi:hypothetical protein